MSLDMARLERERWSDGEDGENGGIESKSEREREKWYKQRQEGVRGKRTEMRPRRKRHRRCNEGKS